MKRKTETFVKGKSKNKNCTTARTRKKPKMGAQPQKNGIVSTGKNIFSGAAEISVTKNRIAVTRKMSQSKNGCFVKEETRKYYPKTPENMQALSKVMNETPVKKLTVKT